MQPNRKHPVLYLIICIAVFMLGIGLYHSFFSKKMPPETALKTDSESGKTVELQETQLDSIKIEPVGTHHFLVEKKAVGSIAYHEQDAGHKLPWVPDKPAAPDSVTTAPAKLIVAAVSENDSPLIHEGQQVQARVSAYPDRVFEGKVFGLGGTIWDSGGNPAIDPVTRRIAVRCEIADPKNELYPGMFANITIEVQDPVESMAVPVNGVVREGDGTMTVWVSSDHKHFEERVVIVGLQQAGYDQILDGLNPGELVATEGALFLDNALAAASQ